MAGEQAKNKLDPAQILDGMLEMDGALAPHYSYFHDYSATNMAYLWMQGAREIVGLKRHWQSVQREPIPGSHKYRIWVPWFRKIPNRDGDEGEEVEVLGGWNDVPCIYTYSQTTVVTGLAYELLEGRVGGATRCVQRLPVRRAPIATASSRMSCAMGI